MRLIRRLIACVMITGLLVTAWGGFIWWVYYKDRATKAVIKDDAYRQALEVRVTELRQGLFVLQGDGGNITALTGPDGLLIVDTDEAWMQSKIGEALTSLQDGPVTHVINTHSHGDHRGGNAAFRKNGADIIAHTETHANMKVDKWAPATPFDLPTTLIGDGHMIRMNGQKITFHYAPFAHTNGDLVVRFMPANVVASGDVFVSHALPFLSRGAAATLDAHLQGQTMIQSLLNESTIIVPGHGAINDRVEFLYLHERLKKIRSYMARLKSWGVHQRVLPFFHPVYAWPADKRTGHGWERFWVRLAYDSLP